MPRKSRETKLRQSGKRVHGNETSFENEVPGNTATQTANQSLRTKHSLSVLSEYCANLYELLEADNQEIDTSNRELNVGPTNLDSNKALFDNNNNHGVRCNTSNKSCLGHKVPPPRFREIVRRKYALPRDGSEAEGGARSDTPTRLKDTLSVLCEMEQTGDTFSRNGVFSRNETRSTQDGRAANKNDMAAMRGSATRAGILVRNEGAEEVVHFENSLSILREMERMEAVLSATSSKTALDKDKRKSTETDPNADYLNSDSPNDLTIDLAECDSPKPLSADHETDEHVLEGMDVEASLYSVPEEAETVGQWNDSAASEEELLLRSHDGWGRRGCGLADDNEKRVFLFTGNDGPAADFGEEPTRKQHGCTLVSADGMLKVSEKSSTVTKETLSVRHIPVIQAKRFCFMATQSDSQKKQVQFVCQNPKQIPVVISTASKKFPVITCVSRKTKTASPVRLVMPLMPIDPLPALPIESIQKDPVDMQTLLNKPKDMSDIQNKPTDAPDVHNKAIEIPAVIQYNTRKSNIHKQVYIHNICDTAIKKSDGSSKVVAAGLGVKSVQPSEMSTVTSEPIVATDFEAKTNIDAIVQLKETASSIAEPPSKSRVFVAAGGLPIASAFGGANEVLTSVLSKASELCTCHTELPSSKLGTVASEDVPVVELAIAPELKPGNIFPQFHPVHKVVDLTSTDMKIVDSIKTMDCEKSVDSTKFEISAKTKGASKGVDSTKTEDSIKYEFYEKAVGLIKTEDSKKGQDSTKTADSVKDVYSEKTKDSKKGVDSVKAIDSTKTVDSEMTVAKTKDSTTTKDSVEAKDISKDSTKAEVSAKSELASKTPESGLLIAPYKSSLTKPWPTFKPYVDPILLPTADETVPPARTTTAAYVSNDPAENEDNDSAGWAQYRGLQSDEERFLHLRKVWGTGGLPNPNRDLTFRHRAAAEACNGLDAAVLGVGLSADTGVGGYGYFVAESKAGTSGTVAGLAKPPLPVGAAIPKSPAANGPSDAPAVGACPKLSVDDLGTASAPLPGSLVRLSATAPHLQMPTVIPVRPGSLVPISTVPISEPVVYPVISERVARPLNANVASNFSRLNATITSGMLPNCTETISDEVFLGPPRSSEQTSSKLDNPELVSSKAVIPDPVNSSMIKKSPPSCSLAPYAVMPPDSATLPHDLATSEATTPTMFDLPDDSVDPYDNAVVGSGTSPPDEVETPINPIRSVLRLSRPAVGSLAARMAEASPCGPPQVDLIANEFEHDGRSDGSRAGHPDSLTSPPSRRSRCRRSRSASAPSLPFQAHRDGGSKSRQLFDKNSPLFRAHREMLRAYREISSDSFSSRPVGRGDVFMGFAQDILQLYCAESRRDAPPCDPDLPPGSRCRELPRGLKRSLEFDRDEPEQEQPPRKRARTIPCVAVLESHLIKTVAEKRVEMAEIELDRARALEQLRQEQAQETSEAFASATRSRRRFHMDKLRTKHLREYHSKNRSYDEAVREVSNEIEAANTSITKAAQEIGNFRSFYHNAGRSQDTTSLINELEFDESMEVFDFYDDLVRFYAPDQSGGGSVK